MMYLRLWILLMLFAAPLAHRLTVIFWALGLAAIAVGAALTRYGRTTTNVMSSPARASEIRTPWR